MPAHLVTLDAPALHCAGVDPVAAVIRGVSVITAGVIAKGHALEVDSTTLDQILACAEDVGQVPVKIDHKSGAASICGFLTNFHRVGQKIRADWHLLKSHPQREQILETAQRMPSGVGLSASFLAPDNPESGKARCKELLSVDYVTLPAANPDGLFSARQPDPHARLKSNLNKAGRVVGAGVVGAIGAAKIASEGLESWKTSGLPRLQPNAKIRAGILGAAGALGATAGVRAALASRRQRQQRADARDLAAVLRFVRFSRANRAQMVATETEPAQAPAALQPIPKRSLVRRALLRAAKVGIGAAGGAYIGRRIGTSAGATAGAVAGLMLQSRAVKTAVTHGLTYSKNLTQL